MSSPAVRNTIKTFIAANSTEVIVDFTAQFEFLADLLQEQGVTDEGDWVGVEFVGGDEVPVGLAANNFQGKYRETGAILFHIVGPARLGAGDSLLTRGETLRTLMRGQRIGNLLIDSVTPMAFGAAASLQFEDGWMSGTFFASYEYDIDL